MCIRFPFHWAIKCFPPKRDIKGIFSESTRFFRIQQFRSGQGPSITISIYLAVDYKGNETRHVGGWSWIICAQAEVANKFLGTKLKKDEQHPASGLRCNKQVIWGFKITFLQQNSITSSNSLPPSQLQCNSKESLTNSNWKTFADTMQY